MTSFGDALCLYFIPTFEDMTVNHGMTAMCYDTEVPWYTMVN